MAIKQVLVVRKDLNMRKGKMVAQGAHASLGLYLKYPEHPYVLEWLEDKFTKIVVGVESEEALFEIYRLAQEANLPTIIIKDAGLTEFRGNPTNTVVAVGPAPEKLVNAITGELELL